MINNDIISLAEKLIACKTVSDRKEFDKCFKLIEDFFASPKFRVKKFAFNGKQSMIISNQKTKDHVLRTH